MAYGLLLYKEIEAPEGTHRLEVYKDGYAGDAIEIDGLVRDSITIQKNGSAVSDAVVTSVLTFALYDTGQLDYSQFFTPNSTLFKVVYKMGGSPRWTGYLTPDSYTENLASHDVITLTARDNLGRLNDYNFSLAKGQMMSARQIILAGLGVAGVSMDTVFLTTKVATSPETILAVDGLVNTTLLIGMTWHEAVTLLLEGLGLTMAWNDANRIEVRDITQAPSASQSAFFISKSGYRMIRPAWKNLTAEQDYGLRDNFYEGQFSKSDFGDNWAITPPQTSKWVDNGGLLVLNPYSNGFATPEDTFAIELSGHNGIDAGLNANLTYSVIVPQLERPIKISLKCNNTAWAGQSVGVAVADTRLAAYDGQGGSLWWDYYHIRFRFNIFLTIGDTKYVLRETWQEYDPSTIEEPYLYFIMPNTKDGLDLDNEVSLYIAQMPGAGRLDFVVYPPVIQRTEDGDTVPQTAIYQFAKMTDLRFFVDEGVAGRANLITVNTAHNIQSQSRVGLGQVPTARGNTLLYLGGLFDSDTYNTPLASFKRSSADEDTYDLLELVARERISFNNDNYNQLSGTMKAASAFYFNRGIVFDGVTYRIVSASLAVLSNTLSVTAMQNEATFADADYVIEEVDSEGGYSSRGSYSGGSVPQGGGDIVTGEAILALAENDASLAARITSLEDWLLQPAFDDIEAQTINVAGRINLGGMEMEYDAENNAWHLLGSLYADGFITAGGLNTSGGGGGSIDLGAMWTSLCNAPIATADVTDTTKIALAHLPYTAGTGLSLSSAGAFSLAVTGVTAGTYGSVTVDEYGRVTAGSNADDELLPIAEGIANAVARITSLEDWLLAPSFDEIEVGDVNIRGALNLGGREITYSGGAWNLTGDLNVTGLVRSVDKLVIAEGLAGLSARVQSLEDWLANPALNEAYIADFVAMLASFGGNVEMQSTASVAGLLSLAGGVKLTANKQIWFSDTVYIEIDANGYIHTNGNFYADGFVTGGGIGSSGGGGGLDLGAMWTSLRNQATTTADVDSNTKIAVAHIPDITVSKVSDIEAWWTGKVESLDLSLSEGTLAGGIAQNAARVGSLEDWMLAPSFDEVEADIVNARCVNIGGIDITANNGSLDFGGAALFSAFSYASGTLSATIAGTTKTVQNLWLKIAGTTMYLGGELNASQLRSLLSINNVENTALSTWGGSSYISTVGTITSGTWHGSAIANSYLQNSSISLAGRSVSLGSSISYATMRGDLNINNVENTALSTWGGSSYISTVGTITSGVWHGSAITNSYLQYSSITLAGRAVSLGGSISYANMRSDLGISNVENVAVSTWAGSTNITKLGTITTGVWHGSAIANSYLENSSISIAGNSVSLGGTLSAQSLISGMSLDSRYLALSGGEMTGDIYMRGGNYGRRIWFGDGSYCYLGELSDDVMTLYGAKNINLLTSSSNYGVFIGSAVSGSEVATPLTVYGRINITGNAYMEWNANNNGVHFSKGIYSDYYITAGSTSSSSDARLKKNRRDIILSIKDIAAAPAVEFDWIDETKGSGAGSIAQYWQELLPQNVKCFGEDGMLSMEYGNIALLASIMLARGYETHEQKIARLERSVAHLKAELKKMRY